MNAWTMLGSPCRIKQIGALRKGFKIPRLHFFSVQNFARFLNGCGLFCVYVRTKTIGSEHFVTPIVSSGGQSESVTDFKTKCDG